MNNTEAKSDQQIVGEVVDGSEETVEVFEDENDNYVPGEQSGSESFETSNTDWESEAKKFQSLHDKVSAENEKMKDALIGVAEQHTRDQNSNQMQNQESQSQSSLSEDEFSPWDAYYKPESASYKYRIQQEQKTINEAVDNRIGQMNDQMIINNTVNELRSVHKMDDGEIREFMQFATKPTDQLELSTLVKVWKTSHGNNEQTLNSVEAAKKIKQSPQSAGSLQGAPPKKRSDEDMAWKAVMGSSGSGRSLP